MLWTIAAVVGLWSFVVLFGLTLMQAASRADEELAHQLRLKGFGRRTLDAAGPDALHGSPRGRRSVSGRPDDTEAA